MKLEDVHRLQRASELFAFADGIHQMTGLPRIPDELYSRTVRFDQIGGLAQADKGVGENHTFETSELHRLVACAETDAVAEKRLDVHVLV